MFLKAILPTVGILLAVSHSISSASLSSSMFIDTDGIESIENVINFNGQSNDNITIEQGGLCVTEHNRARSQNGKGAFQLDNKLVQAAKFHNDWMIKNNCFDHNCPGEPKMGQRVTDAGYRWGGVAENIIVNRADCNEAVKGWMNSPGHKKNILSDNVHMGCAMGTCNKCDWKNYWTCVFARPL